MVTDDIKNRVNDVLTEQLGISSDRGIKPEDNIVDDLAADELDSIEICMSLEEEFGFAIPEEDWEDIKTVQEIYDYIAKREKNG